MVKRLTRFSPWQTAKTFAVVYFLTALIIALPFGLLFSSVIPVGPGESKPGILVWLLLPFLYAILALIFVPIGCWIYNVSARLAGGIEVSVDTSEA